MTGSNKICSNDFVDQDPCCLGAWHMMCKVLYVCLRFTGDFPSGKVFFQVFPWVYYSTLSHICIASKRHMNSSLWIVSIHISEMSDEKQTEFKELKK